MDNSNKLKAKIKELEKEIKENRKLISSLIKDNTELRMELRLTELGVD